MGLRRPELRADFRRVGLRLRSRIARRVGDLPDSAQVSVASPGGGVPYVFSDRQNLLQITHFT